jgi:plastocyanin
VNYKALPLLTLTALGALVLACSSDPATTPTDGGTGTVNGCSTFADQTASGGAITWDFTVTPKCVKVKVGQSVTWTGDFATHPLAGFNGDTPNPIVTGSGGTSKITFPTAGTFGFHCQVHPSMLGAVQVVP